MIDHILNKISVLRNPKNSKKRLGRATRPKKIPSLYPTEERF